MGGTTEQLRRTHIPTPGVQRPSAWWHPLPAVLGALGVVAGILPVGWPVGLALAGLALWLGGSGMRRGPSCPGFGAARTGFVLGLIAVLMALLSAALWLVS